MVSWLVGDWRAETRHRVHPRPGVAQGGPHQLSADGPEVHEVAVQAACWKVIWAHVRSPARRSGIKRGGDREPRSGPRRVRFAPQPVDPPPSRERAAIRPPDQRVLQEDRRPHAHAVALVLVTDSFITPHGTLTKDNTCSRRLQSRPSPPCFLEPCPPRLIVSC